MLSGGKLSEAQQHQAKELDSKMGDKLEITIALKEVCRIIRSKAADALAKDIASNTELAPHLGKCAAGLLEDLATFSDMVHCIAKKLIEVSQLKLFCASYMFPRFRRLRLRFKAESASFKFLKLIVFYFGLCVCFGGGCTHCFFPLCFDVRLVHVTLAVGRYWHSLRSLAHYVNVNVGGFVFCVVILALGPDEVPDSTFFSFLQLKANPDFQFNLAFFLDHCKDGKENKDNLMMQLLRMQTKAVSDLFLEKLRGNASVEMAQKRLPSWLRATDFDDEKQWFLGSLGF
jgi:hypothetical protein